MPEKPVKKDEPPAQANDEQGQERILYTGAVEATVRDVTPQPNGTRWILYTISGQGSRLEYTQSEGALGGRMEGVSGKLYEEGKESATFSAGVGIADKKTQRLTLQQSVVVKSVEPPTSSGQEKVPPATLKCDQLVWDAKAKRIVAKGNVTVLTGDGQVGPMPELWATPDLKTVGTPESFRNR